MDDLRLGTPSAACGPASRRSSRPALGAAPRRPTSRRRSHGESRARWSPSAFHLFPMPAARRWSRSASPSSRAWSVLRNRSSIASRSGGSSITSGPSRWIRARPRVSSSTGPCQSTAWSSRPRSTSHGAFEVGRPAGCTPQRPFIRRWLRRTRFPSNVRSRFLPTASTRSSRRPSIRSATPRSWARGFGDSAATTSPTSGWSRLATRWSASPSGTATPAGRPGAARRRSRPRGGAP